MTLYETLLPCKPPEPKGARLVSPLGAYPDEPVDIDRAERNRTNSREYQKLLRLHRRIEREANRPTLTCPHCSKQFKQTKASQVYCARGCSKLAYRARLENREKA